MKQDKLKGLPQLRDILVEKLANPIRAGDLQGNDVGKADADLEAAKAAIRDYNNQKLLNSSSKSYNGGEGNPHKISFAKTHNRDTIL
ncbi:MAG: hypothetical protein ACKVH8_21775 [Pirellulales bacterium]